jgi:hypothetical protein
MKAVPHGMQKNLRTHSEASNSTLQYSTFSPVVRKCSLFVEISLLPFIAIVLPRPAVWCKSKYPDPQYIRICSHRKLNGRKACSIVAQSYIEAPPMSSKSPWGAGAHSCYGGVGAGRWASPTLTTRFLGGRTKSHA